MRVEDIMTQGLITVDATSNLAEAASHMKRNDVGILPVVDDGKVLGMVTDRDIVLQGVAAGADPNETPVSRVATPGLVWIEKGNSLEEAFRLMSDRKVRRLLVVDEEKKPLGMISAGDVASRGGDVELGGRLLSATGPNP